MSTKSVVGINDDIMITDGENIISDKSDVCQILNDHFTGTQSEEINDDEHIDYFVDCLENIRNESQIDCKEFNFVPVPVKQVKTKLRALKIKKAAGYDLIPPKLVKLTVNQIAKPLTNVINQNIYRNHFPDKLKYANISPAFKKDDFLSRENYRPISVLTCFSKIFEGVMADQIKDYFEPILISYVSAFRSGYSCQSLLLKMTEDWRKSLDKNDVIGALMIDLSKAFDNINHEKVCMKLSEYGFSDSAIQLMRSYLFGRKQRVKIGSECSKWNEMQKGVPQGSVLGPLIFNIFMNDIFYVVKHCSLYNYADDNNLCYSNRDIETVQSVLQQEAVNIMDWFQANNVRANPSKFQCMVLGSDEKLILDIGDQHIVSSQRVKILGVIIDDRLTFNDQISHICKKAARQLNVLRRLSYMLVKDTRMIIYKSFILSNFNFCPLIWHFCGVVNSRKMEKIQERALRFVFGDYVSSYENLMKEAKLVNIYLMRLRQLAVEVYKSLNGLGPKYIQELFSINDVQYDTRSNRLTQPKFKTITYGFNSISYKGTKIWNGLPEPLQNAISLQEFKRLIKTWEGPNCDCLMCERLLT